MGWLGNPRGSDRDTLGTTALLVTFVLAMLAGGAGGQCGETFVDKARPGATVLGDDGKPLGKVAPFDDATPRSSFEALRGVRTCFLNVSVKQSGDETFRRAAIDPQQIAALVREELKPTGITLLDPEATDARCLETILVNVSGFQIANEQQGVCLIDMHLAQPVRLRRAPRATVYAATYVLPSLLLRNTSDRIPSDVETHVKRMAATLAAAHRKANDLGGDAGELDVDSVEPPRLYEPRLMEVFVAPFPVGEEAKHQQFYEDYRLTSGAIARFCIEGLLERGFALRWPNSNRSGEAILTIGVDPVFKIDGRDRFCFATRCAVGEFAELPRMPGTFVVADTYHHTTVGVANAADALDFIQRVLTDDMNQMATEFVERQRRGS